MPNYCLVISGTSGAGKSAIAYDLVDLYEEFEVVKAITTRPIRPDDRKDQYEYTSEEAFIELKDEDLLLLDATYRNNSYGIKKEAWEEVISRGKIPILVITPESVDELKKRELGWRFVTIFVDADDQTLDDRLGVRVANEERERGTSERALDRSFMSACTYSIKNIDIDNSIDLIRSLWDYRMTGGVLPKKIITQMINCGMLVIGGELSRVTSAGYDLRLGREYYHGGKIKTLSKGGFITIEPYDYVIVTCAEGLSIPHDVIGKFDTTITLFCQGVILSNGTHVDPGFHGKLLCLLFNTSNGPVFLKRDQHYATIEFHKLLEPSEPYAGPYQDKEQIIDYLPTKVMQGAISELKKEIEQIKRTNQQLQIIFLGSISLILAVIAILIALR